VTGICDPRVETASNLARMMIGRDLPAVEHPEPVVSDQARLVIQNLTVRASDPFGTNLDSINLSINGGEIVGIAGVSGNGQRELLAALSGEEPVADAQRIMLCGKPAGMLDPLPRRRLGLGFVPEERLGRGAVPSLSLTANALLTAHGQGMVRYGMVKFDQVRSFADQCVQAFDVRCGGSEAQIGSLSGGNVQKFIVGREILQGPKVLIVAQPTWGVDVGATAFIRQSLINLRNAGTAVLVISEELDELFEICDRIAVMAKGRLSPCKRVRETNTREIGLLMTGLWEESTGHERAEVQGAAVQA
jgi:simple sugar transport system ATP-binding protein